jgi:hypothetical protein
LRDARATLCDEGVNFLHVVDDLEILDDFNVLCCACCVVLVNPITRNLEGLIGEALGKAALKSSSPQACRRLRHHTEPEKADREIGSSQQWGFPAIDSGTWIALVDSQGKLPRVGSHSWTPRTWICGLISSSK